MDDARKAKHDNFDKLSEECTKAMDECKRAYAIWDDAVQRLRRLEEKRNKAWHELLDTALH